MSKKKESRFWNHMCGYIDRWMERDVCKYCGKKRPDNKEEVVESEEK